MGGPTNLPENRLAESVNYFTMNLKDAQKFFKNTIDKKYFFQKVIKMTTSDKRIISIDVLRGFALVGMVLVHFMYHYGNREASKTFLFFFFSDMLADWGAAAFLLMMGVSQALSAHRMKNPDNLLLFKRALLRGAYLFVVGLIMLLLAFGPGKMWRWDILTLMGVTTIVLFFCRFFSSWVLLVSSCAIAVFTPYIRREFNIASEWGAGFIPTPVISDYLPGLRIDPVNDYSSVWHFGKIIKGLLLSGYFPILPWVIFPVIGLVIGRRIVKGKLKNDLSFLITTGFFLVFLGVGLAYIGRGKPDISVVNDLISPMCFYPDSFTMINVQAGMSIIVFAVMYLCFDVIKKDRTKLGPGSRFFTRTSNFSLTFYFLHYLLLGWPPMIIYFFTGNYPYNDMMNAVPALICGIVAVTILEILIYYWKRIDAKYSLEWLLAALTSFIVPGYKRGIQKKV